MTARKRRQTAGEQLVQSITAELTDAGLVADSKERAVLDTLRELVDTMEKYAAVVAKDGPLIVTPTGQTKAHPAAVQHRLLAATLPRLLDRVVIADTSGTSKNPTKVRAARVRWDNERNRREARARAAELGSG